MEHVRTAIRSTVHKSDIKPAGRITRMVGVGGTMTTLAAIVLALPMYDAVQIHGTSISCLTVAEILDNLCHLNCAERSLIPGLALNRADIIVAGLAICLTLMEDWNCAQVVVSTWGLRHGIIINSD